MMRGAAILAVLFSAALFVLGVPARAQTTAFVTADSWIVRGADYHLSHDPAIPGTSVVWVSATALRPQEWESGAVAPLPVALKAGERVTGIFWARADRTVKVPVALHAVTVPYASFGHAIIELSPAWQRFAITGTAPADFRPRSQQLNLQLGKAGAEVTLGPLAWLPGVPGAAKLDKIFASFKPDRVASDVRFRSEPGVMLAGTLRLPLGRGAGPFPVAVMLPGQGPYVRGSYRAMLERLIADGIATLEYDKRGAGQSTGTFAETFPLMERDADAALTYLRALPSIDSRRIALIGHSQGGVVAPAVAARDPAVAALVMLAGPVGPRGELFLTEMRRKLAAAGWSGEAIDRITAATARLMEMQAGGVSGESAASARRDVVLGFVAGGMTAEQAEGAAAVLTLPEVRSMYDAAPDLALARVRAPVLALYGEMDRDVSSRDSVPAARAALAANPDAMVIEVAGVDHGFDPVAVGAVGDARGAADLVGDWLEARLLPAKSMVEHAD